MSNSLREAFVVHNKQDPRSWYQKLMDDADDPSQVCVCPFGCSAGDQDVCGYCVHMVGFTNAKLPDGYVRGQTTAKVEDVLGVPDPVMQRRSVVRGASLPIEPGDYIVRITASSRVYKQNPPEPPAVVSEKDRQANQYAQLREKMKAAQAAAAVSPAENPVNPDAPADPVKNPPSSPPPTATPQDPTQTHPTPPPANVPPQVPQPGPDSAPPPAQPGRAEKPTGGKNRP